MFKFLLSLAQARRQKRIQQPTRPVENVALTTKSLQERKTTIEWDDGGKIGNKNKLIHPIDVQNMNFKCMEK